MPINATAEYYLAEKKFLEANTPEERLRFLQNILFSVSNTDTYKREKNNQIVCLYMI